LSAREKHRGFAGKLTLGELGLAEPIDWSVISA